MKIASAMGSVLILASCATATTDRDPARAQPDTGDRLTSRATPDDQPEGPDFTIQTFEGDAFSLAEQRGTPVVINFWESW